MREEGRCEVSCFALKKKKKKKEIKVLHDFHLKNLLMWHKQLRSVMRRVQGPAEVLLHQQ